MKCFVVSFGYDGATSSFGLGNSDRDLSNAIRAVENVLGESTSPYHSAYCWTDGSLYYYVGADDANHIRELPWPKSIHVVSVDEIDGELKTIKVNGPTVANLLGLKQGEK